MRLSNIDPNSFATPESVVIRNIDLAWSIDFSQHQVSGDAIYTFEILASEITEIFLDVLDITINNIFIISKNTQIPVNYFESDAVKGIGSKLTIELPTATSGQIFVQINYHTSSTAEALQWLTPNQTLGKKHPYLFSQCQAILARSLVPCQDTPAVKFTYKATISHPPELTALMSAIRIKSESGTTQYKQTVPIPSYLLAIAVGAIVSKPLGPNSNVWAEPEIVDAAAEEFSETPLMVKTATDICGDYVWKEYDILVMPPSFPFGGMENPCLTFVTPTLLAGDKSLADVVAHEISHSWTGNLITNKNFEHFWLNEGFTMFIEGKIVGRMEGDLARDFHAIRGLNELRDCLKTQLVNTPELTKLVVDLSDVNPEDAFSSVPYIKGQTFLRYLEDLLGGPSAFEPFLKFYFQKYKFQSIETSDFKETLYDYFKNDKDQELAQVNWDLWLYGEGMPPVIPQYNNTLATIAHNHAKIWIEYSFDEIKKSELISEKLTTLQVIEFMAILVECDKIIDLSAKWIDFLKETYNCKNTKNAEIKFRLVRLTIKARLLDRIPEIFEFANSNFRMKYVRPVYRELGQWPEAKQLAINNFNEVKNQMMTVCSNQVAKDLGL